MDSTRLPNKMITKFGERTLIDYDIERAKESNKAKEIVLCTTTKPSDDILAYFAMNNHIRFYRGSEEDKLERWLGAAEQFDIDFFVNFDGDDPFCEPELIDLAIKQFNRTNADFIKSPETPCGAFTVGIKTAALRRVCKIKNTTDTEMIETYFTDTGLFKVETLQGVPEDLKGDYRLTLDYPEDLEFFKALFWNFRYRFVSLRDVIAFLKDNPKIAEINSGMKQRWADNQKAKTRLVLKDANPVSCLR